MNIGIDARLIHETGVGRYIRNLLHELAKQDSKNSYVIFLTDQAFDTFVLPNSRWKKIRANVRWHTMKEQIIMPYLYLREKLDVLHVPYHNPPLLYPGRFVVTIHDLIILHVNTGKATTLPYPLYALKRWAYTVELKVGLARASHIIAVSNTTKNEIIDHFGVDPAKISVTYEGVDEGLLTKKTSQQTPKIAVPYFLYVGNAYPHKNLENLLMGYRQYRINAPKDKIAALVLVGSDDFFYKRTRIFAQDLGIGDDVVFFGAANNETLANLYSHAKALVLVSFMEGFGLPVLEALALGTPVLLSDIPVFHEVVKDLATYVNPNDPDDIARGLENMSEKEKVNYAKVDQLMATYRWSLMAKQTKTIYEGSTRL